MTYHFLGPYAYDNGHYGGIEPEAKLRVPADTWQVDLTDPSSDE